MENECPRSLLRYGVTVDASLLYVPLHTSWHIVAGCWSLRVSPKGQIIFPPAGCVFVTMPFASLLDLYVRAEGGGIAGCVIE